MNQLPDIDIAPLGATCRAPLFHPQRGDYSQRCGLRAGRQFMGCPLCSTHLHAAIGREARMGDRL